MFTFFSKSSWARKRQAKELYHAAALQAREPRFYAEFGVPDTFDGRFEMLCLHIWLVVRKLNASGQDRLAQAVFDRMFKTMDQTIREIGVGDLSVPKHMKRMMTGFNGRAHAYEEALKGTGEGALKEALKEALARNVYGTVDAPDPEKLQALAAYVLEAAKAPITSEEEGNHAA